MPETERITEGIVSQIWESVEPVVLAQGLELVDVEYRRESAGWVLRLYIDRESGIFVDDCARMSRMVGDWLDVADLIPSAYHLEVSSPGLDRPLRKPEHFQKQIGNIIDVRTIEPILKRRNFRGILLGVVSDGITVDCDGTVYEIPLAGVERARLRYFDSIER